MKYTYFFIGLSLFLGSCSNKKVRPSDYYFQEPHPDTIQETLQKDTVIQKTINYPVSNSKQTPSPHYNRSPKGSDNMRGFDPVSEDDMDDNGMSRYMENNDEEGWD
jgi:hypothetical protein